MLSAHDVPYTPVMATPLSALTDQERAQAVARFEILRPFFHDYVPLTQIARQQQLPLRTLTRWVQRYRAEGLAGRVRQRRREPGHHRLPPTLHQLIGRLAPPTPPPNGR